MTILSLVPSTVDILAYAGDTLEVRLTHPAGFVAGRVYTAQVRATRGAATVDAEFTVSPGATEDAPVLLTLPATTMAELVGDAQQYEGVWDCQIAPAAGGDPTQTVAQGRFVAFLDVTRLP
jgi:hypothetical protein